MDKGSSEEGKGVNGWYNLLSPNLSVSLYNCTSTQNLSMNFYSKAQNSTGEGLVPQVTSKMAPKLPSTSHLETWQI